MIKVPVKLKKKTKPARPLQKQRPPSRADKMVRSDVAGRRFARNMVRVHGVKDGDVILIKAGSPPATDLGINTIAQHMADTGRRDCIVVVVNDFDSLGVINEAQMNALGWQRIPGFDEPEQPAEPETVG